MIDFFPYGVALLIIVSAVPIALSEIDDRKLKSEKGYYKIKQSNSYGQGFKWVYGEAESFPHDDFRLVDRTNRLLLPDMCLWIPNKAISITKQEYMDATCKN